MLLMSLYNRSFFLGFLCNEYKNDVACGTCPRLNPRGGANRSSIGCRSISIDLQCLLGCPPLALLRRWELIIAKLETCAQANDVSDKSRFETHSSFESMILFINEGSLKL